MSKKYDRRKKKQATPTPRRRRGDYRIFVGAFITGELAKQVQAIREKYDWQTSQIINPHVTLAGTYWRSGQVTAQNEAALIEKLKAEAASLPEFKLTLGGIYTFGRRVVYLGVLPTDELRTTRHALLNIIGRDKHRLYKPHVTLAMRLNKPEMDEMITVLQASQWHTGQFETAVASLHLMQRGQHDAAWRSIYEHPLKKNSTSN